MSCTTKSPTKPRISGKDILRYLFTNFVQIVQSAFTQCNVPCHKYARIQHAKFQHTVHCIDRSYRCNNNYSISNLLKGGRLLALNHCRGSRSQSNHWYYAKPIIYTSIGVPVALIYCTQIYCTEFESMSKDNDPSDSIRLGSKVRVVVSAIMYCSAIIPYLQKCRFTLSLPVERQTLTKN